MNEDQRLALITRLHGHRDDIRRLTADLGDERARQAASDCRLVRYTSAQILRLRIDVALIESQLAA